ncbi:MULTISPECIES: hypothetical protein [Nocardia]|uniref:hypothetical protein n=1 Tax=Nocardia TaxID=1817 RepID=UPI0007A3A849|nr:MULTISPECIES: hypothetical protein [Nocardia]
MKYINTDGQEVNGEVFAPGPRPNSVWVLRPDRQAVVVKVGTKTVKEKGPDGKEVKTVVQIREEAPYPLPDYCPPLPAAAQEAAQEVVDRYRDAMAELQLLGKLTPIGEDYKAARTVLAYQEKAQQSRLPYIAAHGGNQAVSDRRFKELSEE